jgi:hypothetical protein
VARLAFCVPGPIGVLLWDTTSSREFLSFGEAHKFAGEPLLPEIPVLRR